MDDEARFAEALHHHGRLVRPEALHPDLSKGLVEQLEFYRLVAPDVYCGFLDNGAFNAVATVHKTREFIGIYLGATIVVARYAYCLLADPNVLPHIGDPSRESIEPQIIENLRHPLAPVGPGRYLPRDPVRLHAAQQLAMGVYLVLFFHELAHIELCHLGLLRDRLGLREHQEVGAAPLSEEEALLFRTLEWDADNAGLISSLRMWRSLCANLNYSAIGSLGPARAWFAAAQLLFWVMDLVQAPGRRALWSTHPSPNARLVNAAIVAKDFDFVPELADVVDRETESLIPWILRNQFPSQIVASAAADSSVEEIVQELVEVRRHYETVMTLLDSYQRLRLKRKEGAPDAVPGRTA